MAPAGNRITAEQLTRAHPCGELASTFGISRNMRRVRLEALEVRLREGLPKLGLVTGNKTSRFSLLIGRK